tara:strand:- start:380 stop:652 length:273 start_codon:yes stop_codon:yes gene_type:complete
MATQLWLSQTAYQLHLNSVSTTAGDDFSRQAATAYKAYIHNIRLGKTRIPTAFHADAVAVFNAKIQLNQAYVAAGESQSYYQFITSKIPR